MRQTKPTKIGQTRRKTQTNQEGIDHAKNNLSDRAHLVLIGMLDLEAVDDPLVDVASCFQHSHMLVVSDGRCDHLRFQPVYYIQRSKPAQPFPSSPYCTQPDFPCHANPVSVYHMLRDV